MRTLFSNLWMLSLALAIYNEKKVMNKAVELRLTYGLYLGRNFWGRVSFRELKNTYHFITYNKPKQSLKKLIYLKIWIAVWLILALLSFLLFRLPPIHF